MKGVGDYYVTYFKSIKLDAGVSMGQSFLQRPDRVPSAACQNRIEQTVTSGWDTNPACPSPETLSHTSRFRAQSSDARFSSVAFTARQLGQARLSLLLASARSDTLEGCRTSIRGGKRKARRVV